MKKLLYLLILILLSGMANAQIVNIPDTVFKNYLVNINPLDTVAFNAAGQSIRVDINLDGEIQESEALAIFKLFIVKA